MGVCNTTGTSSQPLPPSGSPLGPGCQQGEFHRIDGVKSVAVEDTMEESSVRFGTSGARGLVQDLTDEVAYVYTKAFLQHLMDSGQIPREHSGGVAIGGDLRSSSQRIMEAAALAVEDMGLQPINVGNTPSPAVALYGIAHGLPTVMVTGSHIPDDRNGIKFTSTSGEITKDDEIGIRAQSVDIPAGAFFDGMRTRSLTGFDVEPQAAVEYVERYRGVFPENFLAGKRIGLYQHSAVGRDLYAQILEMYGATVILLNRSESFVPVDTEAIRPEDVALARGWSAEHNLYAIVSTDGDSDRPLVGDERGRWLRGDIIGLLTASALEADVVCTPVSSSTSIERSQRFREVRRTKIGSPYVIAAMQDNTPQGTVCGFEANGGFLLQTDAQVGSGRVIQALPTRDAVLPGLAILATAVEAKMEISALVDELPQRFTESDRLQEFPTETSAPIVQRFKEQASRRDYSELQEHFGATFGQPRAVDTTDGVRVTFQGEEELIIHLRPSGNAPEFRCYTEANTQTAAQDALRVTMRIMQGWRATA
jgi:phosphomannomutase